MSQPMPLEDLNWREDALDRVEAFARSGEEFTSDDVRDGFREPQHPNQWGGIFHTLANRGVIQRVGFRPSHNRSRRGGVTGIWQGVNVVALGRVA